MNNEWSLKELYDGFSSDKFKNDMARLDELVKEFTEFCGKLPKDVEKDTIRKGLEYQIEIKTLVYGLLIYSSLRTQANTGDEEAAGVTGVLYQKYSQLASPETSFNLYISKIENVKEFVKGSCLLEEHEFYLESIKEDSKYLLSPEVENALGLMSISGSNAWSELQGYLTSTVTVEYDGKITTLSDIRNKAYDPDPSVRKSAYEAELKAYDKIKDAICYSLNSIKLEVISTCKLRGYESPLDQALKNSKMERKTLDALMDVIRESIPKFHEYLKTKAKLLGHDNGLPWYDLFAPLPGNEKKFTIEECKDYLDSLFRPFNEEEADMMKRAFDEAWIDFYPRPGKVGGAFCETCYPICQSRILTNYDGGLGDVVTLAHELGHAYHNLRLEKNSILNIEISMPVAETASTFNEVVAMNAAIASETDKKAKLALIESQLMDAAQIICDIYSRYLFETSVFENRETGFMFPDKLCELMLDAQKKAYGDGLDQSTLHPYMWACKSHYYSGGLSYYNFPYAFGGLFARGLYAKYLKDGESFVPLYKKLLTATGTTTVEGAAKVAGIDLTDKSFWRDSMKILTDEIDEFILMAKDNG